MSPIKLIRLGITRVFPEQLKPLARKIFNATGLPRWIRKSKARQLKIKRDKAIANYGTFDCEELKQVLYSLGIHQGDVLFVQTSFNDLYTLAASPIELLSTLLAIVGPTGTLLMPAYTMPRPEADWIFDSEREPTYTGIVNEIFRRSPGVIRSLHPRHSICGVGLKANEILSGHEECIRADGMDSPFDKMRLLPNAKILTLGLPKGYTSFLHWIEDIAPEKLPFIVHEQTPEKNKIKLGNDIKVILDYRVNQRVASRLSLEKVSKHLSKNAMQFISYKEIPIVAYPIRALADELLSLRDRGIIHYS